MARDEKIKLLATKIKSVLQDNSIYVERIVDIQLVTCYIGMESAIVIVEAGPQGSEVIKHKPLTKKQYDEILEYTEELNKYL